MSLFTSNIRSETKAKFDSLLKSALRKKPAAKSREKLVEKDSDDEINGEVNEEFEMENFEEDEDKKYIMDKFLKDANQEVKLKAPIPKPRKKVSLDSQSSSCTYLVSPKKDVEGNKVSLELNEESKGKGDDEDEMSETCNTEILDGLNHEEKGKMVENKRVGSRKNIDYNRITKISSELDDEIKEIDSEEDESKRNVETLDGLNSKDMKNVKNKFEENVEILESIVDSGSEILEVVVKTKKLIPKPRRRKINMETSSVSTEIQSDEGIESCEVLRKPKIEDGERKIGDVIKPVKPRRNKLVKVDKKLSGEEGNVLESSSGIKMSNEGLTPDFDKISYEKEIKAKPRNLVKLNDNVEGISEENVYKYEKILDISVHRTDKLQLDSYVIHPVVKIHLVDSQTGQYLKKSDKTRRVLFYYENSEIDFIGPIMTHPYNLQEKRSLYPNWEENILINEDMDYLKTQGNLIIFFEIMDFLSIDLIKASNNKGSLGWHKIAWAFIKPTQTNLNKKLRLQLHQPHKPKSSNSPEICEIFSWWARRKFTKYPSTLHISLHESPAPKLSSALRSKTPHQKETGKKIVEEKIEATNEGGDVNWSKIDKQLYRLPNKCAKKLDGGDDGCFLLKFSNSGNELACCVLIDGINTIVIYSMLNYEEIGRLPSHQGLIYNLIWSQDDGTLISASADCTVSIWDLTNYTFRQMLPHPSYVYSCDYHSKLIITGCYDKYIRIWTLENDVKYKLCEELKGHKGYVTTLSFNKDGQRFYSGDSLGVIIVWNFNENSWNAEREIKVLDIKGIVINQIMIYKREKRMLVNTRDDKIRSVDIKTGIVLQTYCGAVNSRVNTKCCISPCGNFVFGGSESGDLYVWGTDSGKVEMVLRPFNGDLTIHCVSCHPKDECIAFGHYGNSVPVLLYKHDRDDVEEVGDGLVSERISSLRHRDKSLDFNGILQKMDNIIGVK